MTLRPVAALCAIVIGLTAPAASADERAAARDHFQKGTKLYNLGRFSEAVAEYEAAYQVRDELQRLCVQRGERPVLHVVLEQYTVRTRLHVQVLHPFSRRQTLGAGCQNPADEARSQPGDGRGLDTPLLAAFGVHSNQLDAVTRSELARSTVQQDPDRR